MKRTFFILVAISLFHSGIAQKITLTKNGLRDANNLEKSFVVISAEGRTAKELYENSIKYVNKSYQTPEDVIKGKVEGEYLRYDTFVENIVNFKFVVKVSGNIKYITQLDFKDGKVRVQFQELDLFSPKVPTDSKIVIGVGKNGRSNNYFIWDEKNEKIRFPEIKQQIEEYFNKTISDLKSNLNEEKNTDDDW